MGQPCCPTAASTTRTSCRPNLNCVTNMCVQ
jgi:hypothetical protein